MSTQHSEIEYLFLSESSIIGGIETLFVRMAAALAQRRRRVTLLSPAGPLIESVPSSVEHIEASPRQVAHMAEKYYTPMSDSTHVSIWCSHPFLLRHAYRIQKFLFRRYGMKSNSISGMFIPAQWEYPSRLAEMKSIGQLLALPPGSVYFMSDAVSNSFRRRYGPIFRKWPVQRLAMSETDKTWIPASDFALNVVSVGRLASFKTYNFGASDVVKTLTQRGVPCIWTIWGDGEDLERAKSYSHDIGVSDKVIFRGSLPYHQLEDEVRRYDVFVGMGTAALEASRCGVPTVIALADSKDESYGYLFECPGDSIGEFVEGSFTKRIAHILEEFYESSPDRRREIGEACKVAVKARVQGDSTQLESDLSGGIQYPPPLATRLRMELLGALAQLFAASPRQGGHVA